MIAQILKVLRLLRLIGESRYRLLVDYLTVEKSDLFDAEWYLGRHPELARDNVDPVWHYCAIGWRKGYCPGPLMEGEAASLKKCTCNPVVERMGRAKVSVVVTSYNYAGYIRETIESLRRQTYGNIEIVVVDDGSGDGSVDVIREYVRRDSRVKLFMHPKGENRGLPATVKLGVEKASGEYVAFCESDDMLEPANIDEKMRLVKRFNGEPDIVINDLTLIGDEARFPKPKRVVEDRMRRLPNERNEVSPLTFRNMNLICTFSCSMVRRAKLLSCDFENVPRPTCLDWWLWRQVCCGSPLYVVHRKLTRWRIHDSFMTKESAVSIARQREFIEKMDALLVGRRPEAAQDLKPIVDELARYELRGGRLHENGEPLAEQPFFSIVMPAYNRRFCIERAIDSALRQTYANFELVVVDDGSTDGTEDFVRERYAEELSGGKIVFRRKENSGVCKTRNVGLRMAKGDWIAYLDSDNELLPFFLEVFARAILANPGSSSFYAKQVFVNAHWIAGRPFDLDELLRKNFIDLGVYVHRRSLVDELGPFDENMTRLVDWELILRQSKKYTPTFINTIVMLYNDDNGHERITNSAKLKANFNYVKIKHCGYPVVTTMITAFNHRPYLKRAIESAIMQRGSFVHEIIVADDCSTDGTAELLDELKKTYPEDFTVLPTPRNLGIAENMRRCFAAAKGRYIAVLEGDDYWITPWKLNRQVNFLAENPECSMVFTRIKLLDGRSGRFSLLARQQDLGSKLTGEDFIKDPNQNLIANFSSCMFVASLVKNLPEEIYAWRLNEISMSFYLEQKGPIGFLPDITTVYRIHGGSTWSAAGKRSQLTSGIRCREVALRLCAPQYRDGMKEAIEKRRAALEALGEE